MSPFLKFLPALVLPACAVAFVLSAIGPTGVVSTLLLGIFGDLLFALAIDLMAAWAYGRIPESARFLVAVAVRRLPPTERKERSAVLGIALERNRDRPGTAVVLSLQALVGSISPPAPSVHRAHDPLLTRRSVDRSPAPAQHVAKTGRTPLADARLLLGATVALGILGVVMVSSTTGPVYGGGPGRSAAVFTGMGIALMFMVSRASLGRIRRLTPVLLAFSMVLLTITLVPGLGTSTNGAVRYLVVGPLTFEPAEIAKLAIILYGAHLLTMRPASFDPRRALAPYLLVCGLACLLILVEPNLGTAFVVVLTVGALIFAAGVPYSSLAQIAITVSFWAGLLVVIEPYRMRRILLPRILSHGTDYGFGFEAQQAEIAIGSGRILGKGLGEGLAKYFYVPEVDSSMIAAALGEEMGFLGLTVLCALFAAIAHAGLRIARKADDRFASLVAVGATSLIVVQAIVNLSSVIGLLAPSGTLLPFISRGNVSLLVMFCAVGLVLAVARESLAQPMLWNGPKRGRQSPGQGSKSDVLVGAKAHEVFPTTT